MVCLDPCAWQVKGDCRLRQEPFNLTDLMPFCWFCYIRSHMSLIIPECQVRSTSFTWVEKRKNRCPGCVRPPSDQQLVSPQTWTRHHEDHVAVSFSWAVHTRRHLKLMNKRIGLPMEAMDHGSHTLVFLLYLRSSRISHDLELDTFSSVSCRWRTEGKSNWWICLIRHRVHGIRNRFFLIAISMRMMRRAAETTQICIKQTSLLQYNLLKPRRTAQYWS